MLSDFQTRCPNGKKTKYYKRAKLEKYASYLNKDGLVSRLSSYDDQECVYTYMCVLKKIISLFKDILKVSLQDQSFSIVYKSRGIEIISDFFTLLLTFENESVLYVKIFYLFSHSLIIFCLMLVYYFFYHIP